jgi:hypothetical protein
MREALKAMDVDMQRLKAELKQSEDQREALVQVCGLTPFLASAFVRGHAC